VKKGLFFFGLLQRGEGTRNLRGRGVKIENGSKAVNALSFIFTVSVLNSFLAYVTVTWCCCWCSWMYELELLLTWFDIDVHECMDERWFEVSIVTSIIYFVYSHRTCVKIIKNRVQFFFLLVHCRIMATIQHHPISCFVFVAHLRKIKKTETQSSSKEPLTDLHPRITFKALIPFFHPHPDHHTPTTRTKTKPPSIPCHRKR